MIKRLIKTLLFPVFPLYGGGGKGGGKSKQTQTQTMEPWSAQQPYLQELMRGAQREFRTGGPEVYQGQRVGDFNPITLDAVSQMQNRATQGSDLNRAGSDLALQTVRGDFLNSNPHLDTMYDNAAGAVTRNYRDAIAPTLDSTFSRAGRFGSGAHQTAHGQAQEQLMGGLNRLSGDIYGNNYAMERGMQQQAIPMANIMAETDYNDMNRLMGVGQMFEGKDQQQIMAEMAKFNEEQNRQYNNLSQYQGLIGGSYGSSAETREPGGSTLGNVIGGGMTGAGIASSAAKAFGATNPWFGVAGAVGGGLLGGLFG